MSISRFTGTMETRGTALKVYKIARRFRGDYVSQFTPDQRSLMFGGDVPLSMGSILTYNPGSHLKDAWPFVWANREDVHDNLRGGCAVLLCFIPPHTRVMVGNGPGGLVLCPQHLIVNQDITERITRGSMYL